MSLFKEWETLTANQDESTFDEFWKEYSDAEIKIYTHILESKSSQFSGSIADLAEKFQLSKIMVTGFFDGINSSLKKSIAVEEIQEDTVINLDIDFEKLYYNMLDVGAEHLFSLEAWDNVLSVEERESILKNYKKSKTIVKEKTPGRNEPCNCGSGKKYKHCCGK